MIRLRRLLLCWFAVNLLLTLHVQSAPSEKILILISIDGFRWDYLQKFNPPHLSKLAADGVHCERLIPAFPSLTFPNHYTLVTGLWPEHHGIIANSMYDPVFKTNFAIRKNPGPTEGRWWGGEPIWVTAIKQGQRAHCLFWPGSEAEIKGIRPTAWRPFDLQPTPEKCVNEALAWLKQPASQRPNLVTLYFHHLDTAAHHHGIESPELAEAVVQVDNALGQLLDGLNKLKLEDHANLIIVSDHGMTELSPTRALILSELIDTNKMQIDFSGSFVGLRPPENEVTNVYKNLSAKTNHFAVYLRDQTPPSYHYRNNRRIPPIILVPDEGWYVVKSSAGTFEKAMHGYDPYVPSMGATLIASGPAFQPALTIPPVENIHIYNFLCATLDLQPAPNDGDDRIAQQALVKKSP